MPSPGIEPATCNPGISGRCSNQLPTKLPGHGDRMTRVIGGGGEREKERDHTSWCPGTPQPYLLAQEHCRWIAPPCPPRLIKLPYNPDPDRRTGLGLTCRNCRWSWWRSLVSALRTQSHLDEAPHHGLPQKDLQGFRARKLSEPERQLLLCVSPVSAATGLTLCEQLL